MARYLCNRCDDDWSDDVDGYCTSCREALEEIDAQIADEMNAPDETEEREYREAVRADNRYRMAELIIGVLTRRNAA